MKSKPKQDNLEKNENILTLNFNNMKIYKLVLFFLLIIVCSCNTSVNNQDKLSNDCVKVNDLVIHKLSYNNLDTTLKLFFFSKMPYFKITLNELGDTIRSHQGYAKYSCSLDSNIHFKYKNPGDKYATNYLQQIKHKNDLFYIDNICYDLDLESNGYIGPYVLYKKCIYFMNYEDNIIDKSTIKQSSFYYINIMDVIR